MLPLATTLLSACDGSAGTTNAFYKDGVYLSGNFKPVDVESPLTEFGAIRTIPQEFTGQFLRNRPNPLEQADADSYHWFTGDGMMHGLRLDNGKADWYRNRWVRSESVIETQNKSVDVRDLGFGPNTNVIGHCGRTWAIVESGSRPIELSYTLDTVGPFGDSLPRLDRWTINPKLDKVFEQIIDERTQGLPRCHPDLNSKPYQYGYVLTEENQSFPRIYKQDLKSGTSTEFNFGAGRHGAEPNFIPKQSTQSEEDGYLMPFVYDEQRKASELIILDALDLSRPALAQIKLSLRVPCGFHGNWLSDKDVS